MDGFKSLAEVNVPSPQLGSFVFLDPQAEKFEPVTLEYHHQRIDEVKLNECVPDKIRRHFAVSKNLLLYAWYVYRFVQVSEMHAAITLELALKTKCEEAGIEKRPRGLGPLINFSIRRRWVANEGFSVWQSAQVRHQERNDSMRKLYRVAMDEEFEPNPFEYDYLGVLEENFPFLRNYYAHGVEYSAPGGFLTLRITAEFINQLFSE